MSTLRDQEPGCSNSDDVYAMSSEGEKKTVRKDYLRLREMFDNFERNFRENKSTRVDEEVIKAELDKLATNEQLTLDQFMHLFDAMLKYRCFIKCLFSIKVCYLSKGNDASSIDRHIDRLIGIYCYIMLKKDMANNRPAIEKYVVPELIDIIRRLETCEQEPIDKALTLFNSLVYNIEKIARCNFQDLFDQSIDDCEEECWEKSALKGILYMHMDRRDLAAIFYGQAINILTNSPMSESRKAYFQFLKSFASGCVNSVTNWTPLDA